MESAYLLTQFIYSLTHSLTHSLIRYARHFI